MSQNSVQNIMDAHILNENTVIFDKKHFLRNKFRFKTPRYYYHVYLLQSKKQIVNKFIIIISVIIFFINLLIVDEQILYDIPDYVFIQGLTLIISILTMILTIVYFLGLQIDSKIKQKLALKSQQAAVLSIKSILILIFVIIHPNIFFVNKNLYTSWKYPSEIFGTPYNFFFIAIQNSRILIWCTIRFFMESQLFVQHREFFIQKQKYSQDIKTFKIRYLFKKKPGELLIVLMVIIGLLLAQLLRISEGVLMEGDEFSFSFWINCIWTVYLNMLTTGYASCYPQTLVGNTIAVVSGVIGNILFSVMLLSFSNFIELKRSEQVVKKFIEQDLIKVKVRQSAAKIIQLLMKSFCEYKKENWNVYLNNKVKLEHEIIQFRQIKKNFDLKKKESKQTLQKRLSIVQRR